MNIKPARSLGSVAASFRRSPVAVVLISAAMVMGCSGKPATEIASDQLAAGLAAQASGDLALARTDYVDCLKSDALNKYCLYNLGLIAQIQSRPVEAENDYRLALVGDPDFSAAIFNLAIIRSQAGGTAEAITLYQHYVELNPANADGHLNLGLLLRATGQSVSGSAEIAKALLLNPKLTVPAASPAPTPKPTPSATTSAAPSASEQAGADASPAASSGG